MDKKERKKNLSDFFDKITMKKLRIIILICLILSLLCEFLPDIINIYGGITRYNFFAFLLYHSEFFTNVSLGCLGSAIISYFILCIPQRLKTNEKKETIEVCFRGIINECLSLNSLMSNSIFEEISNGIEVFKNTVNITNMNLKNYINDFLYYYEDLNINNAQYNSMRDICNQKLLLIVMEIDAFCSCLDGQTKIDVNHTKNEMREIQALIYNTLNNKYNFKGVIGYIIYTIAEQDLSVKILKDLIDSLKKNASEERITKASMYYSAELIRISIRAGDERELNLLKKMKVDLIEHINSHIDSLEYGKMIEVDGKKMYCVDEKNMKLEEYREYCIEKELEKIGFDKDRFDAL